MESKSNSIGRVELQLIPDVNYLIKVKKTAIFILCNMLIPTGVKAMKCTKKDILFIQNKLKDIEIIIDENDEYNFDY